MTAEALKDHDVTIPLSHQAWRGLLKLMTARPDLMGMSPDNGLQALTKEIVEAHVAEKVSLQEGRSGA